MTRSKRKNDSHIIGEQAVKFVKSLLPVEWTIRELVPDYGIDIEIELFEKSTVGGDDSSNFDTLGEHLFVQVKGTRKLKTKKLTVKPRYNVELKPISDKMSNETKNYSIDVAIFSLETSELVTAQRMGAAIPMLLFLVDVTQNRLFYICLNDYIDKIILPEDPEYAKKHHKTIYIPLKNEITSDNSTLETLRFYAKRPKFYAAFQKFSYQRDQLNYVCDESLIETAQYFANILLRYDFWSEGELWPPMKMAHEHLRNLVTTGSPQVIDSTFKKNNVSDDKDEEEGWITPYSGNRTYTQGETILFMDIRKLWDQLVNLGAIYEVICRQWDIPTSSGVATSGL